MFKKIFIFTVSFLILTSLSILVYFLYQVYSPITLESKEQDFVIEKGQGVNEISENLKKAKLIKNKFIFETYVFLRNVEKNFQVGEYKLESNINMVQLAKILTLGIGAVNEREIKIIEGWTLKEIGEYLEKEKIVDKKEFLDKTSDPAMLQAFKKSYKFLEDKPEKIGLEGYLFPDTYRIFKNAKPEDILKKMLDNFDRKLTLEMREDIKVKNRTIFEAISLASIVEREVPKDKDRKIVAGIFWKRLEAGIPLQADSTLNYFTGRKSRALSSEELKIDSFYNTYLYPGLPPTPISNPGLSSLRAAIYPEESPYWYFLSKEDGETIFSQTFKEHVEKKMKWVKKNKTEALNQGDAKNNTKCCSKTD